MRRWLASTGRSLVVLFQEFEIYYLDDHGENRDEGGVGYARPAGELLENLSNDQHNEDKCQSKGHGCLLDFGDLGILARTHQPHVQGT